MISGVLVLHGLIMDSRRQRPPDWRETESFSDAAARLLAGLDERKKRRLAGAETPAEIKDRPWSQDENADGASNEGSGMLKRRPQSAPPRGGNGGDHVAKTVAGDGLESDGHADLPSLDLVHGVNPESTARPDPRSALGTDRTVTRSGRFG